MFSKYSVKKPYTVIVGIIMVIVLGFISFQNMTTDLLPSMDLPYVVVYTTYVGATPEQIEQDVTRPLESSFATLTDIKNISSNSMDNVSVVIMEFNEGANMDTALIEISSKVDQLAGSWDDAIGTPVTMKLNPDMLPVAIMAVNKEDMDIFELSEYVEDKLVPQFEAINGVASASASGLIEQRIDITIEQSRIDVLNSAILREVDEELAEVESQLNDAQAQISDGKKQLARTKKSTLKQINDGLDAIEEGADQIQPAIDELTKQRDELQKQRDELAANIEQLEQLVNMSDEEKQLIQTMEKSLAELKKQKAELEKKLEEAESATPEALAQQRDEAKAQRDELAAERNALESYVSDLVLLDRESLENAISQLESDIASTEAAIESTSGNLDTLKTQKSAVEKEVEDLTAKIESMGGDPTAKPTQKPADTEAPENTKAPETTDAPENTKAPEDTETPEATDAPEDTETPETTDAPEDTNTPEATDAPEDTNTPEATDAPEDTETPEATDTPEDTNTPEATDAPGDTNTPEATDAPGDTNTPEATDTPGDTDTPEATDASDEMSTSEPTAVADVTDTPEDTESPAATDKPEVTEAPAATDKPESTEAPAATDKPEATEAPAATDKPEATEAPAATDKPEATKAPEATEKPESTEAAEETKLSALQSVMNFLGVSAFADEPTLAELQAQLADAQTRLAQLDSDVQKAEDELGQLNSALSEQKSDLASKKAALETLEESNGDIQGRIEEATKQIASLTERIAALDIEILTLDAQIAAGNEATSDFLKQALAAADKGISEIENSDAYKALALIKDPDSLNATYIQAQEGLAQMDAGLGQMNGMLDKLNKGIIPGGFIEGIDEDTKLSDAKEQLKNARSKASSAFSDAEDQLESAAAELANARKEFNEKRDEALESAGLDGVITLEMVSGILGAQNFSMPAGYVHDLENDQILVRVGDKLGSLDELRQLKLFDLGLESIDEVRLLDVASVEITDNSEDVFTKLDGSDGILLSFEKQSTYSTAEVAEAILKKADALVAADPTLHVTNLMDQGEYITIIVDSVLSNLLSGGGLAILILLLFLLDWRPTLTVAFSIPVSVVTAFVCMYFSGITLNVLSLSGLALGIGMLVDNSIVAIENIYRLHEEERMPLLKSCVLGVQKVAGALFSSTLTTICVFLPVVFVEGMARDLFADMGLTIAYSLLASLVVAMTVVPAMCSFLMKRSKPRKHRIFTAIQNGYLWLLKGALRFKLLVLVASIVLLAYSVMQIPSMGISFMPEVNSTQMSATLHTDPEMPTKDQQSLALNIMNDMMEVKGVKSVGLMGSGSASILGGGGEGSMSYYIIVDSEAGRKNRDIAADMSAIAEKHEADLSVQASTMDLSAMAGTGISINILGDDLNMLQSIALEVADIASQVDGAIDIDNGLQDSVPEMHIIVDKEKAIDNGLTVAQVLQFVATKLYGPVEVTQVTFDGKELSVYVVDGANAALTPEDIENLEIEVAGTTETKMVRIGDIAAVEDSTSLTTINRAAQRRQVTVSFGIADGYSANLVSRDLEALLDNYQAPEGYDIVLSGENEMVMGIMEDLILMIVVAVIMIFLIMVAQFQSFKSPIIVMFTIPLAFTGGMLALMLTGMDLSIVSMLGFLVLSGVVVNNGIVFIDCVNQLRIEGYEKREAILEAGRQRLRPILMTALTTILGMSTMALAQGQGAEMMQPMAVVSIGGLTYSTLMTLFIVPVLYDLFNGKKLKAREVMMMKEAAGLLGDEVLEGDSVTDSADGSTASASVPAEPSAAAPIMPAVPEVPTEPAAPAAVPAPAIKPDFSLPPVKPAVPPKKGAVKVRLKTK